MQTQRVIIPQALKKGTVVVLPSWAKVVKLMLFLQKETKKTRIKVLKKRKRNKKNLKKLEWGSERKL